MNDLTLFEAQMGGAFDRLNWQPSREFDQNFSKMSNASGFACGGAWAILELTGTLWSFLLLETCIAKPLQKVACFLCLLYTSPSPRDLSTSRMPSSA